MVLYSANSDSFCHMRRLYSCTTYSLLSGFPAFHYREIKRDKVHPHILSTIHSLTRRLVSAKLAKAKTEA